MDNRKFLSLVNGRYTLVPAEILTLFEQIMTSTDRVRNIVYADFSTINKRITSIIYSSVSVGHTATKQVIYNLVGSKYVRIGTTWEIV